MSDLQTATASLLDPSTPIITLTRALFILKNINTQETTNTLLQALTIHQSSILLQHEICYILGQTLHPSSLNTLQKTLANKNINEIVRHEAGEALGNFNNQDDHLKMFINDNNKNVRETCYLAICKAQEYRELPTIEHNSYVSQFGSIDPAFPCINLSIEMLENMYLNDKCLYKQYKAMFALRNINNEDAVHILGKGMKHPSELFRHEVAFVFGQMKREECLEYLVERLSDLNEHEMVRHECAEAIGAIGSVDGMRVLLKYRNDPSMIVRESVEVALDINEYMIGNEMEYAEI